jgi:hypothetical protein
LIATADLRRRLPDALSTLLCVAVPSANRRCVLVYLILMCALYDGKKTMPK